MHNYKFREDTDSPLTYPLTPEQKAKLEQDHQIALNLLKKWDHVMQDKPNDYFFPTLSQLEKLDIARQLETGLPLDTILKNKFFE